MIDELLQVFPTPVRVKQLRAPTDAELNEIIGLEQKTNQGNTNSVDTDVLKREALSDLRTIIQKEITDYFNNVWQPPSETEMIMTQSWCNYTDAEQWHHKHRHNNSAVSGVYYVQASDPSDHIVFYSPLAPYQSLHVVPQEINLLNAPSVDVSAQTGFIVLFPSYLEHSVNPTSQRKDTRISLAFNAFYRGRLGVFDDMTELRIG